MTSAKVSLHPSPIKASAPVRAGQKITPWIDGVPFFTRLQEAMREAQHSVWFVVSFLQPGFCFPDGTSFWDQLDECVERGVDVRVLFWRNPAFFSASHVFQGDEAELAFLRERTTRWKARWDSSGEDAGHCHHQKFWLVDVGTPSEVGFVGGMVFSNSTLDTPSHSGSSPKHDVCVELQGSCLQELVDTFLLRWNHPCRDSNSPAFWPSPELCDDLPPHTVSQEDKGEHIGQISRTMRAEQWPGLERGENSIFAQMSQAIMEAREWIYIESQHPGEAHLLEMLLHACERGVQVLYIVPGQPMEAIAHEKHKVNAWQTSSSSPQPRYVGEFHLLQRLAKQPTFTMASLVRNAGGFESEIYVHAKVCFVDGVWGTCGSANLVNLSFHGLHSELNLSFWSASLVDSFVRALWEEHTHFAFGQTSLDDALQQTIALARKNREKRLRGESWTGHLVALDSALYPLERF
jgi:phosphatidylserine/phosphatidylglycerophosphate/cardiolipin synthase-like enzyme